jgi:hypothetical protein
MVSDRGQPSSAPAKAPAVAARTGLLGSLPLRWIAAWSIRRAILVLLGFALASLIATIVIGHEPGFLIGLGLIVGSVIAAVGARRAVHRLIPVPALSYLVTTTVAGAVHDQANLNDSKEFLTSFLTWIGSAFFALVWATVLIVVIAIAGAVIRWRLGARQPGAATPRAPRPADASRSGQGPGRDAPAATSRVPRPPRGDRAPWHSSQDAFGDQAPGGNAFGDTQIVPDAFTRDTRRTRNPRDSEPRSGGDPRGGRSVRDDRDPRDERGSSGDRGGWDDRDRRSGRDGRPARRPQYPQESWDDDRPARGDRPADDGRGRDPYSESRGARRPRGPQGPRDLW